MNYARNSSIELLRIFAAVSVFIVHYNYNVAFRIDGLSGGNFALLHLLDTISIPAVDIFMIITGYFSCLSYRRSFGKPMNLIFQVAFWHVTFYIISCLNGDRTLSLHDIVLSIVSPDYFVTLYVCVYILSPYLNMLIERLSIRDFRFMLCLILGIFSLYTFEIDFLYRDLGINIRNGSAIGITGGGGGCTFVNFCLLYLVGSYIRKADVKMSWRNALCGFAFFTFLLCCWRWIEMRNGIGSTVLTARSYHNPLVISQASFALLFVKNFDIYSKVINKLASAVFTCYMIHGFFLKMIGIEFVVCSSVWMLLTHIVISVLGIYILAFVLDSLYRRTINHIFFKINNITIPYTNDNENR